jgi:hypothetical protein
MAPFLVEGCGEQVRKLEDLMVVVPATVKRDPDFRSL